MNRLLISTLGLLAGATGSLHFTQAGNQPSTTVTYGNSAKWSGSSSRGTIEFAVVYISQQKKTEAQQTVTNYCENLQCNDETVVCVDAPVFHGDTAERIALELLQDWVSKGTSHLIQRQRRNLVFADPDFMCAKVNGTWTPVPDHGTLDLNMGTLEIENIDVEVK